METVFEIGSNFYFMMVLRLMLACILGGIIGYEREHKQRPAGFRTHILVCVGSALVMVTSEFLFRRYQGVGTMDPARLGAQVISGIGFLGAGTIIREGASVKGLTTAASLWAVSCVGLAAGIGFYEGAILATVIIFFTLILLRRWEKRNSESDSIRVFHVLTMNIPGRICAIGAILEKYSVTIKKIEFSHEEQESGLDIRLMLKMPSAIDKIAFVSDLQQMEGTRKVFEE